MNHPSELISVIIPAYNHERFVGAAIGSVLNQTYNRLELIIVDDGSTDGTPDVIAGFHDDRIRAVRQSNQDAYNALNRGLAMARGEMIAILNSDDVYPAERLAALAEMRGRSGAACLFTNVRPVDARGQPLPAGHPWRAWHERNRRFYFDCGDLYTAFLKGNLMVGTSNLFLNAELARAVGEFALLHYLHDYDYISGQCRRGAGRVRYAARSRIAGLPPARREHHQPRRGNRPRTGSGADHAFPAGRLPAGVRRRAAAAERLLELERELQAERAVAASLAATSRMLQRLQDMAKTQGQAFTG